METEQLITTFTWSHPLESTLIPSTLRLTSSSWRLYSIKICLGLTAPRFTVCVSV